MTNSVQDGVEGLRSLHEYGWYRGGPVFVYDSEGNDISSAVHEVLRKNTQSTEKTGENPENKITEPSIVRKLLQLFGSRPDQK